MNALPNPEIQNNFMLYLRLTKTMSRFLYTCRYTDFKLPDITNPTPQRLEKILSAIINFCRHREEMLTKSKDIERYAIFLIISSLTGCTVEFVRGGVPVMIAIRTDQVQLGL
jgi:hypothetical protein